MKSKPNMRPILLSITLPALFVCGSAGAQSNTDKGLADQLKQQYKLSDTVLIVQKEGILGVPSNKAVAPEAVYKEGEFHAPGFGQLVVVGTDTRKFKIHEKVHVMQIAASVKHDKVVFQLEECAECNGDGSDYRAYLAFIFPKGYLANADAGQIEDVISQVLTIDAGSAQPVQPAPVPDTQASGPPPLTNDDVVKMVQAQLPDSVIIAKIKSSTCAFDTSPDALIGLKKAGVSAAVLRAVIDGPPAGPGGPTPGGPRAIALGQTVDEVVASLGQPQTIENSGSKQTYVYKNLKVVFLNGKVSDVQ